MASCVISQPRFFPGLHYLHRMMVADIFVVLDAVQFSPRHEEHRTRLKGREGPQWLSVPIQRRERTLHLSETCIAENRRWRQKAVATIRHLYARAPYFSRYCGEVSAILEAPYKMLLELDCASWQPAVRDLGITCRFVRASELPVSGHGPELLLQICKHVDANVYLSGAFGRSYLNVSRFANDGVTVMFHEYRYPVYPQLFGEFAPWLSYLDMLFNIGLDRRTVAAGATSARGASTSCVTDGSALIVRTAGARG
jgi:hypothetical protein